MTDMIAPSDTVAKRNVLVLVGAQAILGAQMPMIFTIAGLAGQGLAPNACLATLPITCMVVGSMLTATPISAFMQKHGRRAGFVAGAVGGAIGAAVGALGLYVGSFALFCLGALPIGSYQASAMYYRFAALEAVDQSHKGRATAYVLGGGVCAAERGREAAGVSGDCDELHGAALRGRGNVGQARAAGCGALHCRLCQGLQAARQPAGHAAGDAV